MTEITRNAWDFPGTLMLLDDDETFLESLAGVLQPAAIAAFTTPGAALRHLHMINDQLREGPLGLEAVNQLGPDTGAELLALRKAPMMQFIRKQDRFATVQIAIVDQIMPALPGTVFCRQIKNLGIKTILLSGQMNDRDAIAAFNEGFVDRYLAKNDPDVLWKLSSMIEDLRSAHARERSAPFSDILSTASRGLFDRHDVWSLLYQIRSAFPFCEHYIDISAPGFLLINENGDYRFLLIDDAHEQRLGSRMFEEKDEMYAEQIAIANGQMMIWNLLQARTSAAAIPEDYSRFLFPATRHGSLVWALIPPEMIPVEDLSPRGSWSAYRDRRYTPHD
jgi:CheY-like chemotaxis protein